MAHSNQIREFLLTGHGVAIARRLCGSSGLLTGSARVAQEAMEQAEVLQRKQQAQRKSVTLKQKRQRLEAQIAGMRSEFAFEEQGLMRGAHEIELQEKQIVVDRVRWATLAKPTWSRHTVTAEHEGKTPQPKRKKKRNEHGMNTTKEKSGSGKRKAAHVVWSLRLYIAGETPRSIAALANLQKICDEHLAGRYRVEVVDLLKNPQLAEGDQIVAVPTLVRRLPPPLKRIIGDLSNSERVIVGLDLRPGKVSR